MHVCYCSRAAVRNPRAVLSVGGLTTRRVDVLNVMQSMRMHSKANRMNYDETAASSVRKIVVHFKCAAARSAVNF